MPPSNSKFDHPLMRQSPDEEASLLPPSDALAATQDDDDNIGDGVGLASVAVIPDHLVRAAEEPAPSCGFDDDWLMVDADAERDCCGAAAGSRELRGHGPAVMELEGPADAGCAHDMNVAAIGLCAAMSTSAARGGSVERADPEDAQLMLMLMNTLPTSLVAWLARLGMDDGSANGQLRCNASSELPFWRSFMPESQTSIDIARS